jgi:hypothetical protein
MPPAWAMRINSSSLNSTARLKALGSVVLNEAGRHGRDEAAAELVAEQPLSRRNRTRIVTRVPLVEAGSGPIVGPLLVEVGDLIRRLDAAGGVVVRSPSETARGNFGIYDLDKKLITLIGAVQLNRGGSQVMGSRLVIDLDSGRAVIDGGAPGVGQSGGRVIGHFTVPKKTR